MSVSPTDPIRPLGFTYTLSSDTPPEAASVENEGEVFERLVTKEQSGELTDEERETLWRLRAQYEQIRSLPPPNAGTTN